MLVYFEIEESLDRIVIEAIATQKLVSTEMRPGIKAMFYFYSGLGDRILLRSPQFEKERSGVWLRLILENGPAWQEGFCRESS